LSRVHLDNGKGRFFLGLLDSLRHSSALLTVLALIAFSGSGARSVHAGSPPTGKGQTETLQTDAAEVQADTLSVHSGMSTTSSVVKSLGRGDQVSIRLQVSGAEGSWCKIAERGQGKPLGYVVCWQLKRLVPQRTSGTGSRGGRVPVIYGDSSNADTSNSDAPRTADRIVSFDRGSVRIDQDPNINYHLNPSNGHFYVRVPPGYSEQTRNGLIVFIDSDDQLTEPPRGWAAILDARHLLFIAPQNAGNRQNTARRLGLGVLAASEMLKHYRIDRERIYVSGYSGGSRIAGILGFFQPDLFRGTIQNCGTDFYRNVPKVNAISLTDNAGHPFLFEATEREIQAAKRVRFALITGSEDFRRGNILDIFYGGFTKAGFQAKLFDVPGMSHDVADGATLNAVLDFLESGG
jgi:hypothetical protein